MGWVLTRRQGLFYAICIGVVLMAERGLRVKRVLAELNHKFSPELYKEEAKQRHKRS